MRNAEKAREIFDDAFVAAALGDGAGDGDGGDDGRYKPLVIHSGVDVTDAETLDARLFAGVTQVRIVRSFVHVWSILVFPKAAVVGSNTACVVGDEWMSFP